MEAAIVYVLELAGVGTFVGPDAGGPSVNVEWDDDSFDVVVGAPGA